MIKEREVKKTKAKGIDHANGAGKRKDVMLALMCGIEENKPGVDGKQRKSKSGSTRHNDEKRRNVVSSLVKDTERTGKE